MLKKKIWANFQRIVEVFTQKIFIILSNIWVWDPGSEIRDPEKTYSGSWIPGSKRHRIPDPGSATLVEDEASLLTLKAAAVNPEGSFMLAAAEAGLEVGGDAPVITEAVGPLVTTVVGKTRPPAWTSLQLTGSTIRL